MRSDYHDRRARRIEHLANRAEEAQAESARRHAAASQISYVRLSTGEGDLS